MSGCEPCLPTGRLSNPECFYIARLRHPPHSGDTIPRRRNLKIGIHLFFAQLTTGAAKCFRSNVEKGSNIFLRNIPEKISIIFQKEFVFGKCIMLAQHVKPLLLLIKILFRYDPCMIIKFRKLLIDIL
jgi:hypothetical protein